MLLTIAAVLLVLWALGFFVATLGTVVHVLLVLAIVAAVAHFFMGAGTRTSV